MTMTTSFKKMAASLTKTYQARLAPLGCKISIGPVGSFLFVRITDPDSLLTAYLAQQIVQGAGQLLVAEGLTSNARPLQGMSHFDGALVANWQAS